jgi:hypothetical protein
MKNQPPAHETQTLELAPQSDAPPQSAEIVHHHEQDPVAKAIAGLMHKGTLTDTDVTALERLSDLYIKLQANDAEKQFAAAFNALQAELNKTKIVASKPVPNNDGTIRYKYAPYEEIRKQLDPFTQRYGFTITFSSEFKDGRIIQTCTLQHVAGHKRSNSFGARIGKGPPGSSDAQGDGAASTYAKRFALCDCFGIVIERDSDGAPTDARELGAPIGRDKVQYLREQLKEAGGSEEGLLKLAGVPTLEDVGEAVYPVLCRALEARKRAANK